MSAGAFFQFQFKGIAPDRAQAVEAAALAFIDHHLGGTGQEEWADCCYETGPGQLSIENGNAVSVSGEIASAAAEYQSALRGLIAEANGAPCEVTVTGWNEQEDDDEDDDEADDE